MTSCALLANIDLVHFQSIDLLTLQQLGFADIVDLNFLQHLANNHLDVLVVDIDALQAIDLLNFVHQIGGQFFDALDGEDVVRGKVCPRRYNRPFSMTSPS